MKKYYDNKFSVDYDTFLSWVQDRFGTEYHESSGEIKINSIFVEDKKFHLWCNPEKNLFHCWKSDEGGTLVKLVSQVDKVTEAEASKTLGTGNYLKRYDIEISKLFKKEEPKPEKIIKNSIKLPEYTVLIKDLSDYNPLKKIAINYLTERKIPYEDFFVCVDGKYRDRIIIPYRSFNGEIQYWNGRDLTDKHFLRYWGPSKKEYGVGKEDFVYFYKWPKENEMVFLTEGEFDAASLTLFGFNGAAVGGKNVSSKQKEILDKYKICMAFDNDEAGKGAFHKVGMEMLSSGKIVYFIRPPLGYKDWNALFIDRDDISIKKYIFENIKIFDRWNF